MSAKVKATSTGTPPLSGAAAIAKAQEARSFLAAFAGHDFSEFAVPGHHDRRHLAAALDHMEELAAMVLALAEQVPNA